MGGANSGNCAMGSIGMHTAPAITIIREVTVENTGRWIKKSANKAWGPFPWEQSVTTRS